MERGFYSEALRLLAPSLDSKDAKHQALHGELLFRAGRLEEACDSLTSALKAGRSDHALRATCLEVAGLIAKEREEHSEALTSFREAQRAAEDAKDPWLVCRVQLSMLPTLLDSQGVQGCTASALEVRQRVLRTGDPGFLATLHLRFGQLEARRANWQLAERHLDGALRLLETAPNAHIEGLVRVVRSVVFGLGDRLDDAIHEATEALRLGEDTDARSVRIAAHGNLAQLNLLKGDLTAAEKHLRACFETVAEGSQAWRCFLDTAAQLDLVRGDLEGAEAKLSQISDQLSPHAAEPTWPNIEVNLTRIQLLQRAGKLEEAVVLAERAARLARSRADGFLEPRFRFKQVELLVDLGRKDEALGILSFANLPVRRVGLPLLAETDRVRSRVLAAFGLRTESVAALSRARRVEIATGRNSDLRESRFD